jgi:hypothetical protein
MGHGVIAKQVPRISYLTRDLGPLPDKPSDEKERGTNIVLGENVKQS